MFRILVSRTLLMFISSFSLNTSFFFLLDHATLLLLLILLEATFKILKASEIAIGLHIFIVRILK